MIAQPALALSQAPNAAVAVVDFCPYQISCRYACEQSGSTGWATEAQRHLLPLCP
jgi:hypothetical protein